jgi:hypothetical protein
VSDMQQRGDMHERLLQQAQQQGQQGATPQLPPAMVPEDPAVGVQALLRAIRVGAEKAAAADSAAEFKDFGNGALAFAQVIITLDPTRLAGGDTPQARADATPRLPATRDGNHDGRIGA